LAEAIAGVITLIAAFRLPLLLTMIIGVGTVVLVRSMT
jgi:uncharacterized membrane protein